MWAWGRAWQRGVVLGVHEGDVQRGEGLLHLDLQVGAVYPAAARCSASGASCSGTSTAVDLDITTSKGQKRHLSCVGRSMGDTIHPGVTPRKNRH